MSNYPNPASTPVKARRGCFFYGCLTGLILAVILIGGAVAGFLTIKAKLNRYTDSQPMSLPRVQMSPEELERLQERWKHFRNSLQNHKSVAPLVVTADELNALLENTDTNSKYSGRFFLSIDGNKTKATLSLPLEPISSALFKGRYLNGSGTFSISLRDGQFTIIPDAMEVKGTPLPREFMDFIRNINFADGFTNDPQAMTIIRELQSVEVKEGKVIVTPKESATAEKP